MVETATVPGAPARVAEGFGGAAGGAAAGGLGPTARGSGGWRLVDLGRWTSINSGLVKVVKSESRDTLFFFGINSLEWLHLHQIPAQDSCRDLGLQASCFFPGCLVRSHLRMWPDKQSDIFHLLCYSATSTTLWFPMISPKSFFLFAHLRTSLHPHFWQVNFH